MRYKEAAQLEDGSGWRYIEHKSGMKNAKPVGYCAGRPPTSRSDVDDGWGANSPAESHIDGWDSSRAEPYWEMIAENRMLPQDQWEKYHDGPHESKEDAQECYAEYLFDQRLVCDDPAEVELEGLDDVEVGMRVFECEDDDCETKLTAETTWLEIYMAPAVAFCTEHQTKENCWQLCLDQAKSTSMMM